MKKTALIGAALYVLPLLVFAQQDLAPVRRLINSIGLILNSLIPILIVLALLYFFWGLVQYIKSPEIKTGRQTMIAGILALFIMVSVWGIVKLVQSSLGVTDNSAIQPPTVPLQRP